MQSWYLEFKIIFLIYSFRCFPCCLFGFISKGDTRLFWDSCR